MQADPSNSETFLFTSIEGDPQPHAMLGKEERLAVAQHDRLVIDTIEAEDGVVFKNSVQGFRAVFAEAANAIRAALKAQMALQTLARSGGAYAIGARVQIALHSGDAEHFEKIYTGPTIARLAAMVCAGHGGQILVSDDTRSLVRDSMPYKASWSDLGLHGLPDSNRPIRIWQLCHPDLPLEFPKLNSRNLAATNLPVYGSSFVGRKAEIARIRGLIRSDRPVTMVGEAGIGKTRLAQEVGFAELDGFPAGVWLIALESVPETSCLALDAAAQIGVRQGRHRSAREALAAHLGDKRALLILDHCDHLVPACADLVGYLRERCPNVAILATGSAMLGVDGERPYHVPPLAEPPAQAIAEATIPSFALARYESIRLYLERVRALRPEFELTSDIAAEICRLCTQVNGNALAIELAASTDQRVSVEDLTDYIAASSPLAGSPGPPEYAASDPLGAMLDWSYGALNLKEKLLLLRLSVFAGGWDLDAVEAICADPAEEVETDPERRIAEREIAALLDRLVACGLVQRYDLRSASRYRLPAAVLAYSRPRRQRMREDARIRARHSKFFFRLMHDAWTADPSPERSLAEERLAREDHNLRAAIAEALDEATQPTVFVPPGSIERLLLFSAAVSALSARTGIFSGCRPYAAAALAAPRAQAPTEARATALLGAARLAWRDGERAQAEAYASEAVSIYKSQDDPHGTARGLQMLAEFAEGAGDHRKARLHRNAAQSAETDTLSRPKKPSPAELYDSAEHIPGERLFVEIDADEDFSGPRQTSHYRTCAEALNAMSRAALARRDLATAQSFLGEALNLWRRVNDRKRMASTLECMAIVACLEDKPQWAASLYVAANGLLAAGSAPLTPREQEERRENAEWIRSRIDAALFVEAEQEAGAAALDRVLAAMPGPTLRLVEGGKPVAFGEPTAREAGVKP